MAYASKLSTITAPPAAVLEPLTAVLMPPAGYPNRESFAAGSLGDRTQ